MGRKMRIFKIDDEDEVSTWTCTPSRTIIRKHFSDGSKYTLEFTRYNAKSKEWRNIIVDPSVRYFWTVCAYIGDFKDADKYRKGKKESSITGDGSLKCGLSIARQIDWFTYGLGYFDELHVTAHDQRRIKAYRYLMRLPQFTEFYKDIGTENEQQIGYMGLNPMYHQFRVKEGV